ncbi:hypothetical protein TWF481_012038 [Arthrobotrys musiformis]|uniref:Uncharacterized protein n=1 Tax=Arthrobotrys musiformis TaxID=47236 RepID=A0AAV9VXY2_9PEZI
MKGAPRSTKHILKSLQSQSKPSGPLASLGSIFNHPVLTDSESRVLLNEVNASFRNALRESRHPDDVRPPPSIHNAYANKADNHIYHIVADPQPVSPAKTGSLRDLLSSEALVDTSDDLKIHERSPITIFQNHLLQGTANLDLAIQCCKTFVLNQIKSVPYPGSENEGLRMYNMIRGNSFFVLPSGVPHMPLRGWLAAALLLSHKPSIPFTWVSPFLNIYDVGAFRGILSEIITSYGKIYNTPESPNEDVKFFIHLLKIKDQGYRQRISEHPTTKTSLHLGFKPLLDFNASIDKFEGEPPPRLFAGMAQKLYKRTDKEGKQMLADNLSLWDKQRSPFGVEVLIDTGNLIGAAEYLADFHPNRTPVLQWQYVVLGLLLARQLKKMPEESGLLNRVMEIVVSSFRRMTGGVPKKKEDRTDSPLSEEILEKWRQYKGERTHTDPYLKLELEYLDKKIRDSPELEDASFLIRRVEGYVWNPVPL